MGIWLVDPRERCLFEGLTFKLAHGAERLRALDLRRQVYRDSLGNDGLDELDERAYQLIAHDDSGLVVASFRVLGPELRPFEVESFVDLGTIALGRSPAVLDRMCVREGYRAVTRAAFIPLGMLKLACNFGRKFQLTDFLILALPHLRNFYRSAFFELLPCSFVHPTWGPVYPMHLDLTGLAARCRRSVGPTAQLLNRDDLPNFML